MQVAVACKSLLCTSLVRVSPCPGYRKSTGTPSRGSINDDRLAIIMRCDCNNFGCCVHSLLVGLVDAVPLPSMSRLCRLKPETSVLLVCDVQERFRAGIHKFATVVSGAQRLTRAANELKVPTIVTEQYPKGLGHTVEELDTSAAVVVRAHARKQQATRAQRACPRITLSDVRCAARCASQVEKTDFSMIVPDVKQKLSTIAGLTDAVLCGIEAHVCVQQTSLDLLEMGINVHLCVDAISSQTLTDRSCGLHRASSAGAHLTTTESVLFELIRSKDHPSFKAISNAVKETRPDEALPFM